MTKFLALMIFTLGGVACSTSYKKLSAQQEAISGKAIRQPAQADSSLVFEGVDVTPIVEYIRERTHVLSRPLMVYNWASRPDFQKSFASNGPIAFKYAKGYADVYWNLLNKPSTNGNLFGFGLYTARDPVTSVGYGIDSENGKITDQKDWVLLQLRFPIGFRLFELTPDAPEVEKQMALTLGAVMSRLGCQTLRRADNTFGDFIMYDLMAPRAGSSALCKDTVQKILQKLAPFDAMGYGFDNVHLKACEIADVDSRKYSQAFLVINSDWIQAENFRVFNSHSTDDKIERNMIQSIFNQADLEKARGEGAPKIRLWKDLDGRSSDQEISFYMKTYHFGCSKPPFEN